MRKRLLTAVVALMVLIGLSGCATLDINKMEAKDYVTIAKTVYTQQFDRHVEKSARTDLTDQEKKDLQKLKSDLIRVKPAIDTASMALSIQSNPTQENMQVIMDFLESYYYSRRN